MKKLLKPLITSLVSVICFLQTSEGIAQTSASEYTFAKRFNLKGEVVGTISPDPDGTGPLKFAATRNTFNSRGLLEKVEQGELASWQSHTVKPANWTGFTVYTEQQYTYDNWGRQLSSKTIADGVTYALTQTSYDGLGRKDCVVVRMNPNAFDTAPSDACTLGTQGVDGPDRITKYHYDVKDRVIKIQKAVGTTLEQDYVIYTYNNFWEQSSITDANGNYAEMRYDDYGRLERWVFPSKDTVGDVNENDFEEYAYDANGNRTHFRNRANQVINYTYDALNRNTVKDLAGSTSQDVYYEYDNRGLQLHARFVSHSGAGLTNTYDGFGQLKTANTTMGGTSRTLTYDYDANGNRIEVNHPDNQSFSYEYDGLNRSAVIRENDSDVLSSMLYQNNGNLKHVNRNGPYTALNYDAVNRLDNFVHNVAGTNFDLRNDFSYNAANQIVSRTNNNANFHYLGDDNLTGNYTVNGLNQYTHVNGVEYSYDAKGNLTNDGATTYTYDFENRLTSASGVKNATLKYDPSGRLYETSDGTTTTQFLYDGDALVAEYVNGQITKRYVHGDGVDRPIVQYSNDTVNAGSRQYLYADYLGSIIAITDAVGVVSDVNTYDAYGIPDPGNAGRFAYTGQIFIPELGLYHYKARVYNPYVGRFMQVDPIGYEDQVNLYAYVGNDPFNAVDPNGEAAWILAGAVAGAVINAGLYAYEANKSGDFSWGKFASKAAIGGAVGAMTAAGFAGAATVASTSVGQFAVSTTIAATSGTVGNTVDQAFVEGKPVDVKEAAIAGVANTVGLRAGATGKVAEYANKLTTTTVKGTSGVPVKSLGAGGTMSVGKTATQKFESELGKNVYQDLVGESTSAGINHAAEELNK